jgi:hypothetical protein
MKFKFNKTAFYQFFGSRGVVLGSLLMILTSMLTIFLYPNLVIRPQHYELGDVVERDIKAHRDFFVEDKHATERKRRHAANSVLTIYDYDETLLNQIIRQIHEAFAIPQRVTKRFSEKMASLSTTDETIDSDPLNEKFRPGRTYREEIWSLKETFEKKIGISISNGAYQILEKEQFSSQISNYIVQILEKIFDNGIVANKEMILKESEKGIILRSVNSQSETRITNLKHFYGLDQAKTMVRIIADPLLKDMNYNARNLIVDISQRLIEPNITLNRSNTEKRISRAVAEVKPVLYQIKAGEMLLREGERVTEVQLLKLRDLEMQSRRGNLTTRCMGAPLMIACFLFITYILYFKPSQFARTNHNQHILLIATVLTVFLFLAKISAALPNFLSTDMPFGLNASSFVYGIPIAAGAMTICLFLGIDLALPFAGIMAVFTAFIFQNRLDIFFYCFLSGSMGAYWMQGCKQRKVFINAGVKLAILNLFIVIIIHLYMTNISGPEWLWSCAFAFTGGIGSGIVTAGMAPLLEIVFHYTTDIKLLELANLDQPLLRRLMIEAPGSYNHSVIVSNMAEAAASEIGCNALLAKVCGYYHDIGKIKKSLYFIENQKDGKNRHDKLAPSMSALILMSHIKNGVEIARKYKLGQAIIDTIQQHHGNSLISFFYEKAKKQQGEAAVNINNFRYPGPKPQTREAAIVMLADVVEAASRTLDNPTPARIQGLVQKLFNKIFADDQLSDCELTLKDLNQIAKSFNKMLNGIYHHRIKYPEKNASITEKGKHDHSAKGQPKQDQNIAGKGEQNSSEHLKRLGIS